MGIVLFLSGAILARIIYGPQFAPSGKFKPEQLNAWYFIWTKIVIGIFLGVLYSLVYKYLPLSKGIRRAWHGLKYGFLFWFIITLWDLSHPLVYGSMVYMDQLFGLVYSLCGYLALGFMWGFLYKREQKQVEAATGPINSWFKISTMAR